jgi:hypothetical protein
MLHGIWKSRIYSTTTVLVKILLVMQIEICTKVLLFDAMQNCSNEREIPFHAMRAHSRLL